MGIGESHDQQLMRVPDLPRCHPYMMAWRFFLLIHSRREVSAFSLEACQLQSIFNLSARQLVSSSSRQVFNSLSSAALDSACIPHAMRKPKTQYPIPPNSVECSPSLSSAVGFRLPL